MEKLDGRSPPSDLRPGCSPSKVKNKGWNSTLSRLCKLDLAPLCSPVCEQMMDVRRVSKFGDTSFRWFGRGCNLIWSSQLMDTMGSTVFPRIHEHSAKLGASIRRPGNLERSHYPPPTAAGCTQYLTKSWHVLLSCIA